MNLIIYSEIIIYKNNLNIINLNDNIPNKNTKNKNKKKWKNL